MKDLQQLSPPARGLVKFAWCWMSFGLFIGIFMGLWSFWGPVPVPGWLKGGAEVAGVQGLKAGEQDLFQEQMDYGTVSRRLWRLGHIAFIALSIIAILYANHIDQANLSPSQKQLAVTLTKIGVVGIPTVCCLGSFWLPLKYLFAIPGPAMTGGVMMLAWVLLRVDIDPPPAGG